MKKSALILFFLITTPSGITAQVPIKNTPVEIKFILYSPSIGDNATVYITGSLPELGSWDPAKIPMQHSGDHLWTKSIVAIRPVSIEYKFTRGSWETEAADDNGKPLLNFVLNVVSDTTVRDNILFWRNGNSKKVISGQITGTVKYLRHVKAPGLLSRDIIVWLPPGYKEDKKERYPVLYMQDGQNLFDPATSSFGVDWQADEACDSMIREKIIEPLIIVGIYNTADRSLEYTPGDTGDLYMKFMVYRLKPLIDSSFRTIADRDHTMVGGSSAGGLISFMLTWEYPDVFSDAICFSPAFKILNIDYVDVVKEKEYVPGGVFFYIYNGGIGLDSELQPGVSDMIFTLREKGYREGIDYKYVQDQFGKHSEAYWAKQFPEAVRMCLMQK